MKNESEPRNTRQVVPVRFGDSERELIADAALQLGLPFSSFVREASLIQAAIVTKKVSVAQKETVEAEAAPIAFLDEPEAKIHFVDGEPVQRG